jgi:deoxyribodipyrimidine photolyase-like uncharacterized protein
MNVSKWTFEVTPNYPVKLRKTEDGRFRLTTSALQGKEWVGETESEVMKSFQADMNNEYDRLMFEDQPGWMKEAKEGKW